VVTRLYIYTGKCYGTVYIVGILPKKNDEKFAKKIVIQCELN